MRWRKMSVIHHSASTTLGREPGLPARIIHVMCAARLWHCLVFCENLRKQGRTMLFIRAIVNGANPATSRTRCTPLSPEPRPRLDPRAAGTPRGNRPERWGITAKPEGSNWLLIKWAVTAFRLCTAVLWYCGCSFVHVTIYRRLLIGRDSHLDQPEAYDI